MAAAGAALLLLIGLIAFGAKAFLPLNFLGAAALVALAVVGSYDLYSRLVLVLAALACVLIAVGELSTIASVDVARGSCEVINDTNPALAEQCKLDGFERHGAAFVLLALFMLLMGWGAGAGGSRPAAAALIGVGLVIVAWALFVDLPEADETGAIGRVFESGSGKEGPGLYIDVAGGLVAVGAGLVRLLWPSEAER